ILLLKRWGIFAFCRELHYHATLFNPTFISRVDVDDLVPIVFWFTFNKRERLSSFHTKQHFACSIGFFVDVDLFCHNEGKIGPGIWHLPHGFFITSSLFPIPSFLLGFLLHRGAALGSRTLSVEWQAG